MQADTVPTTPYSRPQIALHWISVPLVMFALGTGAFLLAPMPNDAAKIVPIRIHAAVGTLIGLLVLARLVLRWRRRGAAATEAGGALRKVAGAVHAALYLLVLCMAGSGMVLAVQADFPAILSGAPGTVLPPDFLVFPARRTHGFFAPAMAAALGLHVAGTLLHHWVLGDRPMERMRLRRSSRA